MIFDLHFDSPEEGSVLRCANVSLNDWTGESGWKGEISNKSDVFRDMLDGMIYSLTNFAPFVMRCFSSKEDSTIIVVSVDNNTYVIEQDDYGTDAKITTCDMGKYELAQNIYQELTDNFSEWVDWSYYPDPNYPDGKTVLYNNMAKLLQKLNNAFCPTL